MLLLPPVYFAYEITKSVWKLTCYVFTMHANGGRGWWQFHGKKLEEECREFENPWWRAGSGGLEMNPSSIIIVLLWEMKVKLSTSNRFEANFTWEKRRITKCPAFSWSSSAAAQPRCSAYPHWMFLLKKVDYFFYNWSELRGKEKTFKNDFIFSLGRSIQFFHELKKNYVCIYSLFFSPF